MRNHSLKVTAAAVLFMAALLIYGVHYDPQGTLRGLRYETTAIAASLHDHGTFADPFPTPTGPTAFLAPVYPAWIAMLMNLFGTGPAAVLALQWSVTLFVAVQMALLPWIAERIGIGFWAGATASGVLLLADLPRDDVWEAWLTSLALMFAVDAMVRASAPEASTRRVALTGVGLGALLLLTPVVAPVLVLWFGWLLLRRIWTVRRAAIAGLCVVAGVSPWLIRNYAVFHHVMYVRDNLGMELYADYNDCATYSFNLDQTSGCFAQTHPNESPALAERLRVLGEVEYNRQALQQARQWMRQHPDRVAKLIRQKTEVFWFPSIAHSSTRGPVPRRYLMITVATWLSFAGLLLLWREQRTTAAVLACWMVGFPPVYYLVHYLDRYRVPVLWMTFLLAAYVVIETVKMAKDRIHAALLRSSAAS